MGTPAWIGLGSNLGDRKERLDAAIAALAETPGIAVRAVSAYHETAAVGGPTGQGAFRNAAVAVESTLDPAGLHRILRAIEDRAGRVRAERWGARTLDLDLLLFDEQFLNDPGLQVPHPRMAVRRFVLAPLAEIAPGAIDVMTGRTVMDLLANLDRRPSHVALAGPDGPLKDQVFHALSAGLGASEMAGLDGSRVPDEPDRDRWLVSDLGLDLARPRARVGADVPGLSPTFAIILGGEPSRDRALRIVDFPLLWPEARTADTIVNEARAACAASRGG